MRCVLLSLILAVVSTAGGVEAAPKCAPPGAAKDVEAAVRGWFGAFAREDYAAGYALQAPGFYAYDGGKRYDGAALGELLRGAKASGIRVEWNLHDIDVHVACDQAWAAWVNTGASGKAGALQPVTWLESMVLRYEGGRWRVEFLHSDRVRPPG
ncbi:nuclear transport factor 2 family protein [Phenylobacterium sp.]|uniref:nuclear transport factor 2 family protein n=1 Tax=Phenylobacterium sp. TaxID=1871053 RepID=UPI002BB943D0|nr:nuclear transport factor 2 family protein [Phenylobacterium sp.]HLZ74530.1 nuclear transport factor 2 family protein [Phenylobacterium sp.]